MMTSRRVRVALRISAVMVVVATLWVWQRVTVIKMLHANEQLRARLQSKKELAEKVAAEVSLLRHRARIERIATAQLGLVPTRPTQRRAIPQIGLPVQRVEADGWQRLNNSLKRLRALKVPTSP